MDPPPASGTTAAWATGATEAPPPRAQMSGDAVPHGPGGPSPSHPHGAPHGLGGVGVAAACVAPAGVLTKAPWAAQPGGDSMDPPPLNSMGGASKGGISLTHAPWATPGLAPSVPNPLGGVGKQRVSETIHADPQMPEALPERPAGGWKPAVRRIRSAEDLKRCLESGVMRDFVAFILSLSEAVKGKKLSAVNSAGQTGAFSPGIARLSAMLDTLSSWVDEIPPSAQSLRYGNPAYRTWFAKMSESAHQLVQSLLPVEAGGLPSNATAEASSSGAGEGEGSEAPSSTSAAGDTAGGSMPAPSMGHLEGCVVEVAPYLVDSFGNSTRIDYGTGHETTFCALLYCLARLGVVGKDDREALVSIVFKKYLDLMRKIQTTYWLEPAGSHGVWGLDDYQFLPFLWGASQLSGHPMIKPKSIHNKEIVEMYADEYLYLACVRFVKEVKKGPFSETSPIINDISSVPTWTKVHSGMIKMYQAEVLSKFPIMQHFLFGSLLPYPE